MSNEKRYNGWTNYETWVVKLWMDNDQGEYELWNEQAQESWNDAVVGGVRTRSEDARFNLADMLKEHYEEARPDVPGMWADLLNAALSEVNWDEIADNLLQDVDIEEAEEGEEAEKYEPAG